MSLFDRKEKDKTPPLDIPSKDGAKESSIRSMSGYSNIAEVRRDAPISDDAAPVNPPKKVGARAAQQQVQQAVQTAAKKEEKRQHAMEVIGKQLMSDLATVPYDVWSLWLSDPALALTKDEQVQLAEAYYLLAQAFEPDFSKPIYLVPLIALMNLRYAGRRFAYLAIKKSTGKEIAPENVEQVLMDELKGKKTQ